MRIGFWKAHKNKCFISHAKGLNEEQIAQLHVLKLGDRLVLWMNEADGNSPNFTVKKLIEMKMPEVNKE